MVMVDKEKVFVDEIMEANGLKGASKKRLVRFLGDKYDWDKHRVQFRLTRALLAERYVGEGGVRPSRANSNLKSEAST